MKTKYLAFAAAALMLASCSNDEDFVPQDNLKNAPITVSADVAELKTRAGHDADNLPETFYLSIDQTGTNYDYSNVLMTKGTDNKYTSSSQLLWANGTDNATVTAATFSLDGTQTLSVQTDQSTADGVKASDHLMMATTSVAPSAEGISVNFSHFMSKVMLTITLGDEFNAAENPISNVEFKGTVASNSYTAGTGWTEIATDAETTNITPLAGTYTPINTEEGTTNSSAEYEVILLPQTVAANGFEVQFNIGDRVFKWTSQNAVTLASGYKYTLSLTAGKDMVSSATFSTSAWNAGEGDDNNLSGETE